MNKNKINVGYISDIIELAWKDKASFESIVEQYGLSEADVIKIMRKNLKPKSFKTWRKRVSGRSSKHMKKFYSKQ